MGGVGSTVQFEKAPPEFFPVTGTPGLAEKRDEGPSLSASASSVKRRPPMSLWLTQEGDRTLDAVIQALRLWGGRSQQVQSPESFSCLNSSSGCLLEHHQLLLAWRMSRIGAPGRCGCCESLLPLGGPTKGAPGTRDASERGSMGPCSRTSSTNMPSSTTSGDISPRRSGWGGQEKGLWKRVVGGGAPQPDPSSCYLVIHAYTAARQQQQQQQQDISHVSEGPPDRRRSITPPRAHSPTEGLALTPSTTAHAQCIASSIGSGSFAAAAELLSEDLGQLLTQAETRIAADTRRHSVWHAVHVCTCCAHNEQQQEQQRQHVSHGDMSGSRTDGLEAHEFPSAQPPNHSGEQQQRKEQQQQQHLWAVYLWEGLEAPRYILDHARLRTLRLVEALESCEQRGVPISPVVLLPWASFAVLRSQLEGPRCWPTVEVRESRDSSGNAQEQQPVILDGEALLERNVLLLRLLLRLPRLAYGASPSIPAVSRTAVAAAQAAAAPESSRAPTAATAAAATAAPVTTSSQGEDDVVATSPGGSVQQAQWQWQQQEKQQSQHEQQQQQQEHRSAHTAPFVPRLALPSKVLPRLQLQPQGSSPKMEEPLPHSGSVSNRRSPLSRGGPQRDTADLPGSESSSLASSVSVSPVSSSGEVSPAERQQQRAPSGPLRFQGGLRLQGVPKLAIPRLGGGGGHSPSSAAANTGGEAAGACLSPQRRGSGGISPSVFQEGDALNSRRSSASSAVSQAASWRGESSSSQKAANAASSMRQPSQHQQTALAGAHLSGVSARPPGGLRLSGLLSSPTASPAGLQRYGSGSSNAGSSRESFGSRRRRTDEEGMGLYSRTRQQQLVNFRRVISDVYEGRLFVSGAAAACNLQCLKRTGITHVVNTIGDICPNVFASLLTYKTYYLKDTRQQNIMCVFYDCIRFISEAIDEGGETSASAVAATGASPASAGGAGSPTGSNRNSGSDHSSTSSDSSSKKPHKVLIHCKEGVSRSATLAIAFLMWKLRLPFAETFERMRSRRAICSPNTGFTYQLLLLQKRLGLQHPRAPISNLDMATSKEGQEALRSPPSIRRLISETPSSPKSNQQCATPGKGAKRAGSPLEGPSSPVVPASGSPSPRATGRRAPPSSIASLDLSIADGRDDRACTAGSPLEADDAGTAPRGLGPRAPRICAPPRPGGDREEGSDAPPQGESPFSSVDDPPAVSPLAQLSAPAAAAIAVAAASAGTCSAVEDCVLLLHLVVHSAHSPDFLLWSEITEWRPGVLPSFSEHGVYMLRGGGQAWVWMDSSKCLRKAAEVEEAARNYQENVALVERRSIQLHYIAPGSEPSAFWLTLGIGEGTTHLGVPNLPSGLEPMVPEKSEEPFRWRDYCAFDLPADWGEVGAAEGAFMATGTHQDPPATQGPSMLEGGTEGLYRPCEVNLGQLQSSSNTSSRLSSGVPSVRRSLELFGNPADEVSPQTAAGAGGAATTAAAARNTKGVAMLFSLPNLEEPLGLFDSEDLLPDRVFLLVAEGSEGSDCGTTDATVAGKEAVRAWLWVGANAEFDPERDQEAVKAQVMEAFNLQPGQLQLSLELDGEESETFWSHFANG